MVACRAAVLGLALAVALGGCSAIALNVPDELERVRSDETIDCSSALPMADTVIGAVTLVLAGFGVLEASKGWQGQNNRAMGGLVAIPMGVIGLAYTGSAIYGHGRVRRCRPLARAQVERQRAEAETRLREQTSALIEEGRRSVRAGDCERVRSLAADTQWRAPAIYWVFVRDLEIARCLKRLPPEPEPNPEPESGPEAEPKSRGSL